MIELKLKVSEIDFDAVLHQLGGLAGSAAALAARTLPESAKESLAVKYINSSSGKIEQLLEEAAEKKGVHVRVSGAQASVIPEEGS